MNRLNRYRDLFKHFYSKSKQVFKWKDKFRGQFDKLSVALLISVDLVPEVIYPFTFELHCASVYISYIS